MYLVVWENERIWNKYILPASIWSLDKQWKCRIIKIYFGQFCIGDVLCKCIVYFYNNPQRAYFHCRVFYYITYCVSLQLSLHHIHNTKSIWPKGFGQHFYSFFPSVFPYLKVISIFTFSSIWYKWLCLCTIAILSSSEMIVFHLLCVWYISSSLLFKDHIQRPGTYWRVNISVVSRTLDQLKWSSSWCFTLENSSRYKKTFSDIFIIFFSFSQLKEFTAFYFFDDHSPNKNCM